MPEDKALENIAPKTVKLLRPYGFIDDGGRERFWKAGTVVSGAEEVALLVERGALIEVC